MPLGKELVGPIVVVRAALHSPEVGDDGGSLGDAEALIIVLTADDARYPIRSCWANSENLLERY